MTGRNTVESVRQRLINKARERQATANEIMQYYAMERFLYRLGCSPHRDRFVLKGALMLLAWHLERSRATRDIDLLGFTNNSPENLKSLLADICRVEVAVDDGMTFDPSTIKTLRIKEDAEYEGVRATFTGYLGTARFPMQIDIGFNDIITPGPQRLAYPALLEFPPPELNGYTPETVIAEKLEAMIMLAALNTRMKDFFDIWLMSRHLTFNLKSLCTAIRNTLERRGTAWNAKPTILFNEEIWTEKQIQWTAFLRKSKINYAPATFSEVAAAIRIFLDPVTDVLIKPASETDSVWRPPGPWNT